MKILVITLAMLMPFTALAAIGETKEQCDKRYGKVLGDEKNAEGFDERWYGKKSYLIIATFIDGKCEKLIFSPKEPSGLDKKIAEAIVEKNMDKPKFMGNRGVMTGWLSADGTTNAILNKEVDKDGKATLTLTIYHNNYVKAVRENENNEVEEKADDLGF